MKSSRQVQNRKESIKRVYQVIIIIIITIFFYKEYIKLSGLTLDLKFKLYLNPKIKGTSSHLIKK